MNKIALATVLALLSGAAFAQEPSGTWQSASGETKLRIAPCGAQYCGTIVWTKDGGNDVHNPDANLKNRPLVGVRMATLSKSGDGYKGTLYNYKNGKTYSGNATLESPTSMKLGGCVLGILCRSEIWNKVN